MKAYINKHEDEDGSFAKFEEIMFSQTKSNKRFIPKWTTLATFKEKLE